MKLSVLIILIFVFVSCSKEPMDRPPSVEERVGARGGIPGKPPKNNRPIKVGDGESIQAAIDKGLYVEVDGVHNEAITLRDGLRLVFNPGAKLIYTKTNDSSTVWDGDKYINATIEGYGEFGRDSATSFYARTFNLKYGNVRIVANKISNTGTRADAIHLGGNSSISNAVIDCSNGMGIQTGSFLSIVKIYIVLEDITLSAGDYGVLVSYDSDVTARRSSIASIYNSAFHGAGGTSNFHISDCSLSSISLFPLEMSGGDGDISNSTLESVTSDGVEGSGVSKYGGGILTISGITIKCFSLTAYSIEHQGNLNHGLVIVADTCYINRPIAPTLNIQNKQLLKDL